MLYCLSLGSSHRLSLRFRRCLQAVLAGMLVLLPITGWSQKTTHTDIAFANTGERELLLDLYLPDGETQPPLIVWLHGGIWRVGSKADVQALDDERAYHPEVMDVRGAVALLDDAARAEMGDQPLPAYGQVWALGFMFVVENWPE